MLRAILKKKDSNIVKLLPPYVNRFVWPCDLWLLQSVCEIILIVFDPSSVVVSCFEFFFCLCFASSFVPLCCHL